MPMTILINGINDFENPKKIKSIDKYKKHML